MRAGDLVERVNKIRDLMASLKSELQWHKDGNRIAVTETDACEIIGILGEYLDFLCDRTVEP